MRIVELGDGWKSILKPSILYGNKHICTIEILKYSFDHSKYYRNILITFFKPWSFKVTLQYTMVYFVVLVLDWCADGTLEAAIKCYIIQHRFVFYYVTKECIWYTFLTYGIIMRGCWHTYLQKIFSRGILEIKSRYVMLEMCFSYILMYVMVRFRKLKCISYCNCNTQNKNMDIANSATH